MLSRTTTTAPTTTSRTASAQKLTWLERRREKIVAEIQANKRGEYTVPTWVLAVALVAMIVAICAWLVLV